MRALKTELDYLHKKMEDAKKAMLRQYEAWIDTNPNPSDWAKNIKAGVRRGEGTPRSRQTPRRGVMRPGHGDDEALEDDEGEEEEDPAASEEAKYAALKAEAKERAMAQQSGKPNRRGVKVAGTFASQGAKGLGAAGDYGMQNSMQAKLAGWGQ